MAGRYVLGRKLATGGMAEIFEASVRGAGGFEKDVVVKRVLPMFADDAAFRERFFQEARLAALLSHPNIVQTYELVEQDGQTLLAMEAVHGADIAVLLRALRDAGKAMPIASALYIGACVADALGYAHERKGADGKPLGLVHRDVTPSNVLISIEGVPKLIDFGIAKAAASASSPQTQTGIVLGKAWYLSPEQCLGRSVDGKSDVFALGILLFQMLAGRIPFGGRSGIAAMEKIAAGRRPALSALVPKIPPAIEAVVDAALTVDPAKRPTAKQLRAQLERALASVDPERRARDDVAELLRALFASGQERGDPAQASLPTLLLMDLQSANAQPTDDDSDVATAGNEGGASDLSTTYAVPPVVLPSSGRGTVLAASIALLGAAAAVAVVLYVRNRQSVPAPAVPVVVTAPEDAVAPPAAMPVEEIEAADAEPERAPDRGTKTRRAQRKAKAERPPADVKPVQAKPVVVEKPVEKQAKVDGSGRLTINCDPWAQVWLGGQSLGMTWAGAFDVPAGKQTLFLKNPVTGHEKTITVDIKPGSRQSMDVVLDRARREPSH